MSGMRYSFFVFLFSAVFAMRAFAADTLVCKIDRNRNWAFYGSDKPGANVVLVNERLIQRKYDLKCEIRDAKNRSLYELTQSGFVAPDDSVSISFTFKTADPGFYGMSLYNDGHYIMDVVMAYEPDKMKNENDRGDDFLYFAHRVALGRRDINPQFVMLRNKELSGRERNVYDFSMVSKGDERVRGYIAFPKGKQGLKGMLTLVESGKASVNPLADFTAPSDFVEMVLYLNTRGKGDEVIANSLSDMLLALDFLYNRVEVSKSGIYVQGSGHAGAYAFVSSALWENIAGAVVSSPDFSRFTDKFSISSISRNVSSPILLGLGLQCDISRLQETFLLYNGIGDEKEYFVDPQSGGIERNRWKYIKDIFIKRLEE